jgi:hypothetical protein
VAGTITRDERIRASVDHWLRAAVEDAERRGLPELRPLLDGLAQATITLRSADWNDTMPGGGREEGGRREAGEAGGGKAGRRTAEDGPPEGAR